MRLIFLTLLAFSFGAAGESVLHVAPDGKDGAYPDIAAARDALRAQKPGEPVKVVIHGGRYWLSKPLVFTPEDSGTAEAPITYEAAPGESPILDGGRLISGWRKEDNFWVADVPGAAENQWVFSSLWINGKRGTPARTPNAANEAGDFPPDSDFFFQERQIEEKDAGGKAVNSATKFVFRAGDLQAWESLPQAHAVVFHSWATSLLPIKNLDLENRIVEFSGPARWPFGQWRKDQWYYIEHLFEGLDQPGEWFLNRTTGRLYYIPREGEDMTTAEVVAPVAEQLLLLQGDPANNTFVEHLTFRGLTFQHTNYQLPAEGKSDGQAASTIEAAVQTTGARYCVFDRLEIRHTGNYGLWFRTGSQFNSVTHSAIFDLGAGGVRIGEGQDHATEGEQTRHCIVDNNFINDGGRIFREAVGVWIGRSSHNQVTHNDIGDFRYTGVSVGWSWGYAPSSAKFNRIEFNHIHNIGKGQLNDMGAIYCLGISPGTTLRNNFIHDILSNPKLYGGWGLYTDEGSSQIVMENNVVYNTSTGGFHQHYGKENFVRNNIFAYARTGQIIRTREEEHLSFFFDRNIVYFNNGEALGSSWKNGNWRMNLNLYWNTEDRPINFAGRTFDEWQVEGHDQESIVGDPLFVNAEQGDFTLRPDSPAFQLGFQPIDLSKSGLQGEAEWVNRPKQIPRPAFTPPPVPEPAKIGEDFEGASVGDQSAQGSTIGEEGEASVRVVAETAASGAHSLKFSDAPGLAQSFNPHLVYRPSISHGTATGSFSVRVEPGAIFYHEWRDAKEPYTVGPSIWIHGDGRLTAQDKTLLNVPPGTWVKVSITCGLWTAADGTYDLTVTLPGGAPQVFSDLPCGNPAFRRIDWFGFVSQATEKTAFFLDDVALETK